MFRIGCAAGYALSIRLRKREQNFLCIECRKPNLSPRRGCASLRMRARRFLGPSKQAIGGARGAGVAHCAGPNLFGDELGCESVSRLDLQGCSFGSKADDVSSSAARPFAVSTIRCLPCCLASGGSAIRSARESAHRGCAAAGSGKGIGYAIVGSINLAPRRGLQRSMLGNCQPKWQTNLVNLRPRRLGHRSYP